MLSLSLWLKILEKAKGGMKQGKVDVDTEIPMRYRAYGSSWRMIFNDEDMKPQGPLTRQTLYVAPPGSPVSVDWDG